MPHFDLFLCEPTFEPALLAELDSTARVLAPGLVAAERPAGATLADTDHVFARHVLPDASATEGASISALAKGAFAALDPLLSESDATWDLVSFAPDLPAPGHAPGELERRAALVGAAFVDLVRTRRRRRFRARGPGGFAVQLCLSDRERVWASAAIPATLPRGGSWPMPFPAGIAPVADDWAAPSSAFRKLREAFAWMGRAIAPGERVVDLGASPGGWTHVALAAGALVVAVDRAPLAPTFDGRANLEVVHMDAFEYAPSDPPVDWLVCDVIAYPERSLELLARWLDRGWARSIVLHLKFKGRDGYEAAFAARERIRASRYASARIKKLHHDRNEVTVMAGDLA